MIISGLEKKVANLLSVFKRSGTVFGLFEISVLGDTVRALF
jgi:hypothetical protein